MHAPTAHATAVELFERYPNVSEPERELLIAVFPQLSTVDLALMLSDEDIGPRLDAFRRENASKIRTPFRHYAVLVAIAVVGVLVTLWALAM